MKKHEKHAKLSRRNFGTIAPFELAVLGTKCSAIKELVKGVSEMLNSKFRIAYADASHDPTGDAPDFDSNTFHDAGELVSQSAYFMNPYTDRLKFSNYDLVFINGNHFQGNRQILILDPEKESSVRKRIEQLDHIDFMVKLNEKAEIFDVVLQKYPEAADLKVYSIEDIAGISAHIAALIKSNQAPLSGLVLAGGQSTRMGKDKGLLDYFGKSQRLYSMEMLERLGLRTYLSVRKEQNLNRDDIIEDSFLGLGPFGAICSAFQKDPNTAWLVLATDVPFADEGLISRLILNRDPSKIATAIKGKDKKFPEPLIAIWEPKAYPVLLQFLSLGISCPRKVLINSDVKIVEADDELIVNVNTPEEFKEVKKNLIK